MRDDRKELLTEQYEEAWFSLMLDQYAEEEGNRLLEEYRQAGAEPVPQELDKKCRAAIRKVFKNHDRKQRLRSTASRAGRAAVIGLVTLSLFATMIMSVDALRIPTINFFITQYENFTTITKPNYTNRPNPDGTLNDGSPLSGILPNTFELFNERTSPGGSILVSYMGPEDKSVSFMRSTLNGALNIDTEGAQCSPITVLGHDGQLVIKGSMISIYWIDLAQNYTFRISTRNMTEEETRSFALATAQKFS